MSVKGFFNNWIVKNLLLAIIIVAVLIVGTSFLLKALTRHNEEIRVPDFSNMTVSEARTAALAHNVRIDVTDSVYIKRMARGAVYRQVPEAGSRVKKGRRIALTINSVLPKKITMPNLIGYSAMAGAIGGGGLGDLAIRYGYQRFSPAYMFVAVVVIIIMVELIQFIGDRITARLIAKR